MSFSTLSLAQCQCQWAVGGTMMTVSDKVTGTGTVSLYRHGVTGTVGDTETAALTVSDTVTVTMNQAASGTDTPGGTCSH